MDMDTKKYYSNFSRYTECPISAEITEIFIWENAKHKMFIFTLKYMRWILSMETKPTILIDISKLESF